MNRPLAHSANASGQVHDLADHLRAVAHLAASFADKFGARDLGHFAGLWHDLGKFHPDFQAYLGDPERSRGPDHSSAGAVFACGHCDALAFLVAGHHGGLPDFTGLKNRVREKSADSSVQEALRIARGAMTDLTPGGRLAEQLPEFASPKDRGDKQRKRGRELFMRLLFSALVDADFLDTEAHFNPDRASQRSGWLSLGELWRRFETDQARLTGHEDSPLQRARHEIYQACLQAADQPQGLFRLTVPTGGGKTRSGLAFALSHALRHGLDRVIVAIPYTSIIEQTAEVYRGILGDEGVLEHHSAVADGDESSPVELWQQWARLASQNWDAPVVVTTTVQLFESLFAHRPARCRKLHNVARSVVVLDEVQTLPPHLLDPIRDVLAALVRDYRVTVVFCTATQPGIEANRYFQGLPGVQEIVPEPGRYFRALKRVNYEIPQGDRWGWDRVAREMQSAPQALAVVNTKKDAFALLDALGEDPSALHLSTQMCGAHRLEVLRDVRGRLERGEPCRLVSTQVVEAGVDIDFPLVLRAVGPLDRIVQAAGRCNREGKLPQGGRVVVFDPAEGGSPPGAYRTGLQTAQTLLAGGCDLDAPETSERYFRLLFQAVALDREGIQDLREGLDYPEVARRFRLIDDEGIPVVVRPRGHESAVDRLLGVIRGATETPRWAFRRLQRFVVSLRAQQVDRYRERGLLAPVVAGLWEWQGKYDPIRGLVDAGIDPDQLVI
jgi:CRISPR-associated endonuclease/helicase Cas3